MNLKNKKSSILSLTLMLFILFLYLGDGNHEDKKLDIEKYTEKAIEAKSYSIRNNLNKNFYILIDLNRHSGLNRFFIWDFNQNKITHSFLVSHGSGNYPWSFDFTKLKAKTSNKHGSHKSSIGKYIIGERGYSNWGIHVKYLLHGQDATNSNALKRTVVLHSWSLVSNAEIYPNGTPEGEGCPAVSNNSLRIIDRLLKKNSKRTLMWIIN